MRLDVHLGRMTVQLTRTLTRRAPAESGTTSISSAANITGPQSVPLGFVALAILGLACVSLFIYGRSLTNSLVGDDWVLIEHSAGGLGAALSWIGNYHYNPVVHVLLWVLYTFFGIDPIAYHATALLFFWLGAVGIMYAAWRLSSRFAVGLLAAVLFIAHGRQYEGVIWGAVSIFQTAGFVLFLVGLISYLRSLDSTLDHRSRRWAYGLFVAAVVLSPFAYEPEVVLTVVCMLYRLLVVEHTRGYGFSALRERAQDWARDFALPVVFLAGYLVVKVRLAQSSTQAPGLRVPLATHIHNIAHGLRLAFVPDLGIEGALAHSPDGFLLAAPAQIVFLTAVLAGAVALILRGIPTQRFLLASVLLMIVAMTLGVGSVASRHDILISMPAVILWALLLADLTRYTGRLLTRFGARPEVASALRFAPATLAVAAWVFFGVQYAIIQQNAWKAATARVDQLVAQVDQFIGENPSADALYLIDMPDSAPSPTGDYDDPMYMFRNSPPSLIRLTHPHRFRLVVAAYTRQILPEPVGDPISEAQLLQLHSQPGTLLLQYDAATGSMIQWLPTNAG